MLNDHQFVHMPEDVWAAWRLLVSTNNSYIGPNTGESIYTRDSWQDFAATVSTLSRFLEQYSSRMPSWQEVAIQNVVNGASLTFVFYKLVKELYNIDPPSVGSRMINSRILTEDGD